MVRTDLTDDPIQTTHCAVVGKWVGDSLNIYLFMGHDIVLRLYI